MSRRATTWLLTVTLLIGGTAVGIRAQEGEDEEARAERSERQRTLEAVGPMVRARLATSGGWLGVRVEDVDDARAEELGLAGPRGALVAGVEEESPAAEAGLREGDVIVSFDGEAVRSVGELVRLVRETPAGRSVPLEVMRDGERRSLSATVGDRPGPRAFRFRGGPDGMDDVELRLERLGERLSGARMARVHERVERAMERAREHAEGIGFDWEDGDVHVFQVSARPRLGVQLQSLTDQLAEYFGVSERGGVLISAVREGSPASAAGLRAGDVVVAFDGEEIEDAGDLMRAVREAEAGSATVTVVRRGQEREITVELPEEERAGPEEEGATGRRVPAGPAPPARAGVRSLRLVAPRVAPARPAPRRAAPRAPRAPVIVI